jgi:hypothetical protein
MENLYGGKQMSEKSKLFNKPLEQLEPLEKVLEFIYRFDYPLTDSGKSIAQKERNELKYNLTEVIADILEDNGMEYITRTSDGYIMEIQHEKLGVIPIEINVKVKNIDFDIGGSEDDWVIRVEERKDKEERKQAAIAAKEARKKARESKLK